MVGAEGFEPPTLCSQSRCATRLRYAPTPDLDCIANKTLSTKKKLHSPTSECVTAFTGASATA